MADIQKLNINVKQLIDEAIETAPSTNDMDIISSVILRQNKIMQEIVNKQNEIIEIISVNKKYI
jgi:hypothetical protein